MKIALQDGRKSQYSARHNVHLDPSLPGDAVELIRWIYDSQEVDMTQPLRRQSCFRQKEWILDPKS